jgi:hypothetical protein
VLDPHERHLLLEPCVRLGGARVHAAREGVAEPVPVQDLHMMMVGVSMVTMVVTMMAEESE